MSKCFVLGCACIHPVLSNMNTQFNLYSPSPEKAEQTEVGGALVVWLRFRQESVIKTLEKSFNDLSPGGKPDKSFHYSNESKHLMIPAGRDTFETKKSTLSLNTLADGYMPLRWTEI